jgi:hypothetical protein
LRLIFIDKRLKINCDEAMTSQKTDDDLHFFRLQKKKEIIQCFLQKTLSMKNRLSNEIPQSNIYLENVFLGQEKKFVLILILNFFFFPLFEIIFLSEHFLRIVITKFKIALRMPCFWNN